MISALIPSSDTKDAASFNTSAGDLKLGPAPIDEALRSETERILRESSPMDLEGRPAVRSTLTSPTSSELPPRPPLFKTIDLRREIEKIRDERIGIRLDPSILHADKNQAATGSRARALPSICAYTLHDVGEG